VAEEERGDAPTSPVVRESVEQGEDPPLLEEAGEAVEKATRRREDPITFPAPECFDDSLMVVDKDLPLVFPFVYGAPPRPILPQSDSKIDAPAFLAALRESSVMNEWKVLGDGGGLSNTTCGCIIRKKKLR
jgi:hypothetical protein